MAKFRQCSLVILIGVFTEETGQMHDSARPGRFCVYNYSYRFALHVFVAVMVLQVLTIDFNIGDLEMIFLFLY